MCYQLWCLYVFRSKRDKTYQIHVHIDWLQSLKNFHQCVISYTYSQSNSGGLVLGSKAEPSEFDWLQVYDMTY